MSTSRPLEDQFAPRFSDFLISNPPNVAQPRTAERAKALFEDAVESRASDIHLDPHKSQYCIRFRIDGALHDVAFLPEAAGERMLRHLQTEAEMDPAKPFTPQDGHMRMRLGGESWEFRLSTVPTVAGEKMALRLLSMQRVDRSISDLGLSRSNLELFEQWMADSVGMALVVGPTGSGKTTTLYALLDELKMRKRSIVTIEDPVEYQIEGITQIEVREQSGLDFAQGLKAMLRLDPDYLLVGEVRDNESAETAIDAAGAGHVLLATLHCRDAVGAVTMLRNYGVADHKIAAALELVVGQRLVRQLCEKCREAAKPSEEEKEWLERNGIEVPRRCWRAVGCEACRQTGYHGRLGIFEVWRLDAGMEQMILAQADELQLRRELLRRGHAVLLQDGLEKLQAGETSLSELREARAGSQGYLLRD